jgi:hypothetical protein
MEVPLVIVMAVVVMQEDWGTITDAGGHAGYLVETFAINGCRLAPVPGLRGQNTIID